MDVKLTISSDDKQYFSQPIPLPCVIGRARNCGVAIVHPLVSRQHCEIYEHDGQVFVRDLGSLNGTIYQGMRIGRGVHIPFGDSFTIGRLSFLLEDPEDATTTSNSFEELADRSSSSTEKMRLELDRRVAETSTKASAEEERRPDDPSGPFTLDEI